MVPSTTSPTSADTNGQRLRRACRNCAQVKERCVRLRGANDGTCQRCYRLHKDCTTPAPISRARQRVSRDERQDSVSGPLPTPPHALQTPAPSENYDSPGYWEGYAALERDADAAPVSATLDALDAEKKDALFRDYCNRMMVYFPFVVFEPSDSTSTAASSFAYAAALVASLRRHPSLQKQVSQELLQHISISMLIHGRKSLDLLQGILVLLAWYPFYSQRNPQLMNMLHLAQALLVDLGLTRRHTCRNLPLRTTTHIPELLHGAAVGVPHDSLAEGRALLGWYYVAAQLTVNLRRLEHPRWTGHMEECCCRLEDAAAAGTQDGLSALLLRLHVAAEPYLSVEASKADGSRCGGMNSGEDGHDSPIRAYVRCFAADLDRVRAAAPTGLAGHPLVVMHKHALEIALYDAAAGIPTDSASQAADKVEAMHALLGRLSSLFDLFCGMPVEDMPDLSILAWAILGQATDVLAKLSFLKLDGWDLALVRRQLSVSDVVERLSDKFLETFLCERRRYPALDASHFAVFLLKMRQFRKWYEDRVAKEAVNDEAIRVSTGEMPVEEGWSPEFGGGMWMSESWLELCVEDLQWP